MDSITDQRGLKRFNFDVTERGIVIHSIAFLVFTATAVNCFLTPRYTVDSTVNKLTGIHFIIGVSTKLLGAGSLCQIWHRFFGFKLFCLSLLSCFQYYGIWSSEKVKSRVTEVIFSWTVWFPQEVKIQDAYQMLKKQGSVLLFQFPF